MIGFNKVMRFCNTLQDYESAKNQGKITDDLFVVILQDKLAKFKGQTFDWSENADLTALATKGELESLAEEIASNERVWAEALNDLNERINEIGTGGGGGTSDIVVDAALSTTSTNAIQNKAVANALNEKADASALASKQDTLVSGTNIKTVNGESILGEGNIVIPSGEGGNITVDAALSSTSTNAVQNKVVKAAVDEKADAEVVNAMMKKIEDFDNVLSRVVTYIPDVTGTLGDAFLNESGEITANEWGWAVRYQYIKQDCKVSYKAGIVGPVGIFVSKTIPLVGGSYNIAGWGAVELLQGEIEVKGGNYFCSTFNPLSTEYRVDIEATYTETANLPEKVSSIEDNGDSARKAALSSSYFLGNRMIDTITRARWHNSTDGKIGNFIPLSATDSTITLSSEDAACVSRVVIMACELVDGSCEYAYFSAAVNNVITKLYDFNENFSCGNIVKMQCIHDTTEFSYGQHPSPLGLKAMAKDIYRQLGEINQFSDVQFAGGWTAQYCKDAVDYTDTSVVDSYGNLVCQPILEGIKVGGYDECGMRYKAALNTLNAWTHYLVKQVAPSGSSIAFNLRATHRFKGFLRIVCGREMSAAGSVIMTVTHNGEILTTREISQFLDRYIIPLDNKFYNEVSVIFTMPDATNTELKVLEMTMHETYVVPAQYRTIDSTSVVAVLGDSFTQFPSFSVAQELMPSDPFNSTVIRPDGSEGEGCGYFPKELAKLSGAVVDNWGKSGETTFWGLEQIQKVLSHKRYTHIIISLFANDLNRYTPVSTIISNIRIISEYAKGCGCVPIILMGYMTEADSQSIAWNGFYDCLTQGFDSPFIYTHSDAH